ncbi:hypothetical protein [Curtobacterium sp. MCJR17_043]|uniref:hypothetical protein n=1 Tax=Curtobacterium sp. MCJR17_043 TaxID=2175660 RepID=UPI0024E0029A|nr:hypothetical protein [Curtobacterium sp. MCJR17_043]WIB35557.1 hypothetical protein DEJ15_15370 [Curtobacterium sp. MCJR17_043]
MKANTFCKIGVTFGATALIVGALAVPAAQADPAGNAFGTLVGLGSDTTQDVMNGVATAVGGGQIASYDAANAGPSVVTRAGGKAIPRVSGSGAGRDALLVAIGAIASKSGVALADGTSTTVDSSVVGQLDFARSSSGPSSTASDGVVAYVPFARDAVDVAYAPRQPAREGPLLRRRRHPGEDRPDPVERVPRRRHPRLLQGRRLVRLRRLVRHRPRRHHGREDQAAPAEVRLGHPQLLPRQARPHRRLRLHLDQPVRVRHGGR